MPKKPLPSTLSSLQFRDLINSGKKKKPARYKPILKDERLKPKVRLHTSGAWLGIKPLSVNEAWQGRRHKTAEYEDYEKLMIKSLPPITLPEIPYEVHLTFGFSNVAADFDNPQKLIVDILQKKYRFNDKHIFKGIIEKVKVKKGEEFLEFSIFHYEKK